MTRSDWAKKHKSCWVCGWTVDRYKEGRFRLETHEVARGPSKKKAMLAPTAWVRVCNCCHSEMGDYSIWPISRQYALKALHDISNYDRVALNKLRDREPEAITDADVHVWLETLESVLK